MLWQEVVLVVLLLLSNFTKYCFAQTIMKTEKGLYFSEHTTEYITREELFRDVSYFKASHLHLSADLSDMYAHFKLVKGGDPYIPQKPGMEDRLVDHMHRYLGEFNSTLTYFNHTLFTLIDSPYYRTPVPYTDPDKVKEIRDTVGQLNATLYQINFLKYDFREYYNEYKAKEKHCPAFTNNTAWFFIEEFFDELVINYKTFRSVPHKNFIKNGGCNIDHEIALLTKMRALFNQTLKHRTNLEDKTFNSTEEEAAELDLMYKNLLELKSYLLYDTSLRNNTQRNAILNSTVHSFEKFLFDYGLNLDEQMEMEEPFRLPLPLRFFISLFSVPLLFAICFIVARILRCRKEAKASAFRRLREETAVELDLTRDPIPFFTADKDSSGEAARSGSNNPAFV